MSQFSQNDQIFRVYRLTFYDDNNVILKQFFQYVGQRGLRLQFKVRQQMFMVNNIAEFKIWNPSLDSVHLISKAKKVLFEGGYMNDLKVIHRGRIFNIFGNRVQPDYMITVFTSDSIGNLNPIYLQLQTTQTDRQMIKAVAAKTPLIVQNANLKGLTDVPVQKNILINHISYNQALSNLGDELSLKIWVTNNVLYTDSKTPIAFDKQGTTTTTLNYKNGMIGSPTIDVQNAGIVVKCLLRAALIPGNFVVVETLSPQIELGLVNFYHFNQDKATRGEWKILTVDHVGDTMGDDWYSQVNGYGLKILSTS